MYVTCIILCYRLSLLMNREVIGFNTQKPISSKAHHILQKTHAWWEHHKYNVSMKTMKLIAISSIQWSELLIGYILSYAYQLIGSCSPKLKIKLVSVSVLIRNTLLCGMFPYKTVLVRKLTLVQHCYCWTMSC